MLQIYTHTFKHTYIYIMIVKFYFLWTFWQLFRIKAHQSASGTRTLTAKLAIQSLP